MSAVTRTLVIDPDTGERAAKFVFRSENATSQDDVDMLHAWLVEKSPVGLLEIARSRLADIKEFPEYESAARAIATGEQFAALNEWDRVSTAISDFSACYERAMRRKQIHAERQRRITAGQKSGEWRNRNHPDIIARHQALTSLHQSSAKATAICAREFEVTVGQIRRIIKQTK